MKHLCILIFSIFLTYNVLLSQSIQANQVFLSGIVTDVNTGQPVKCDIRIEDDNTKFSIFSDPVTGKYSQLLNAKKNYTFTFYMWNIYRTQVDITYSESPNYREEKRDFQVITLRPGVIVEKQDIFSPDAPLVKPSSDAFFKQFKTQMRFHRDATWTFYVTANDSYENADSQGAKKLVQDRIASLEKIVAEFKAYAPKITIKVLEDNSIITDKKQDLIIMVDTIKDKSEE
jgi:hypothetical protein